MGIWKGLGLGLIVRKCESNHNVNLSPPTYQDDVVRRQEITSASGEKGIPVQCLECKLVQPLWKTVEKFLKTLKLGLPYDLAISPLGIYPKEMKAISQSNIWTPMIVAALLFTRYGDNLLSRDKWMKKLWYTCMCVYNRILFSHAKEGNPFATTRMNLETLSSVK